MQPLGHRGLEPRCLLGGPRLLGRERRVVMRDMQALHPALAQNHLGGRGWDPGSALEPLGSQMLR